MNEVYTVFLRSSDGTGDDNSSRVFYINWESVLPTKYKKFRMKILFRASEDAGNDQDYIFVNLDCMNPKMWSSTTRGRSNLVNISAQFGGAANPVYQSLANDIDGLMVDYPLNNRTTVSFTQLDGTATTPGNYMMWIQFFPCMAYDEKK